MSPSKNSTSQSNNRTTTSPLKQGVLPFPSAKPTAISGKAKRPGNPSRTPSLTVASPADDSDSDIEVQEDCAVLDTKPKDRPALKRRKLLSERTKSVFGSREGAENVIDVDAPIVEEEERQSLDGLERSGKLRGHYGAVREKMGNIDPDDNPVDFAAEQLHAEGQTSVHYILRVFDLSYEYGPCVGVSRLQRWERAKALGLQPPAEVKEILLTKQGNQDAYSNCIFDGEV